MANVYRNVNGSSYLMPRYWHAHNEEDQATLDELVIRACDTSIPDAEAVKGIADFIVAQAEADGVEFECAYFARHFKDEAAPADITDPATGKKYPHLHFILHVASKDGKDQGCSWPQWERYIGIERARIEKLKSGNIEQQKDNVISYLTHVKYPEKTQYGPEIVYTARGRDYMEVYSQRYSDWMAGRAVISHKAATSKERKALIMAKINHGQLSYRELISTDEGRLAYSKYSKEINNLYAAVAEAERQKKMESYTDHPFVRTNIYFTGDAGHGKTWTAGQLARRIVEYVRAATGEEWSIFDPADGPNLLDDYAGQEIVIFDDLKTSDMSWEKVKRFFDPYRTVSSFGARYKNGEFCSRVNIIANTKNVYEYFYFNKHRDYDEHIDQGLRRIDFCAETYSLDAESASDTLDAPPTNDSLRISLKHVKRLPANDPMRLKIKYPSYTSEPYDYTVRYVHQVPDDLPTWLRPDDAIELIMEKVMKNNGISYLRSPQTAQSIADALILDEQYDPRRKRFIEEIGLTSEGDKPTPKKEVVTRYVYLSPEHLFLQALFGYYVLDIPTPASPEASHISCDLYQLRDYLDMLIQREAADYEEFDANALRPLDFGGNVFTMPEQQYLDKVREYAPQLVERL